MAEEWPDWSCVEVLGNKEDSEGHGLGAICSLGLSPLFAWDCLFRFRWQDSKENRESAGLCRPLCVLVLVWGHSPPNSAHFAPPRPRPVCLKVIVEVSNVSPGDSELMDCLLGKIHVPHNWKCKQK